MLKIWPNWEKQQNILSLFHSVIHWLTKTSALLWWFSRKKSPYNFIKRDDLEKKLLEVPFNSFMRSKSMDWFLYDSGLRHERVKLPPFRFDTYPKVFWCLHNLIWWHLPFKSTVLIPYFEDLFTWDPLKTFSCFLLSISEQLNTYGSNASNIYTEAAVCRCSSKQGFFKILQYSMEKHLC